VVCKSDDIPHPKSAKLKCGHRMCNSCLKRIFRLSVCDPSLMPPRCCTNNHIPLKHVDRLFDLRFKTSWNNAFQEFTTKTPSYCRSCVAWLRPADIHKENGETAKGTRYGKCSNCEKTTCLHCLGARHRKDSCPGMDDDFLLSATAVIKDTLNQRRHEKGVQLGVYQQENTWCGHSLSVCETAFARSWNQTGFTG
jgi:hypothetical protein